MDSKRISRRPFLKALAWGSALAPLAGLGLAQAAGLRVRYDVYSAKGQAMLASYAKGVTAMKALKEDNPLSWTYQAAIHGTYAKGSKLAWNSCQHRSWFFISWHRMYVYWFEEIIRQMSGDTNFTLPYWNYTDIYPDHAIMPAEFRDDKSGNPLYVKQRAKDINNGKPFGLSVVQDSQALATIPFTGTSNSMLSFGGGNIDAPAHFSSYTGQLEQQPHNVVHSAIGGWMGDPNTAAQDPIFWLHHCNIDRLWNDWLNLGQGRSNPTDQAAWMDTKFTFFNPSGTAVEMTASQILDSASQLGYVYDNLPAGGMGTIMLAASRSTDRQTLSANNDGGSKRAAAVLAQSTSNIALGSVPLSLRLTDSSNERTIETSARNALLAARPVGATVLVVEGVQAENNPEVLYEVYVNLPEGATPDPRSIHYAGTLSFFGAVRTQMGDTHAGHGAASGNIYSFNITRLVAAQQQAGKWTGDTPNITFVPVDGTGAPSKVADGSKPSVAKVMIVAE